MLRSNHSLMFYLTDSAVRKSATHQKNERNVMAECPVSIWMVQPEKRCRNPTIVGLTI
jgi:hypothetical protein